MWVILGIISAFFLGIYDVMKKTSLNKNSVLPVLFLACLIGAIIFLPFYIISKNFPEYTESVWFIHPVAGFTHFLILLKSFLVLSSWTFAYYSFKHLPVTIASPIRTSAPLWTLIGAIILFGEKLSLLQWGGLIICIISYYLFSLAGKKEGINFSKNKWVLFITIATILGSISSLYDKFLIKNFDRMAVQVYYSFYMVLILLPVLLIFWYPNRKKQDAFQWRYSIPFISISLALADFLYFYSLSFPGSMISILSTLRRSSVIVSFGIGSVMFREENLKMKFYILLGILGGIILIVMGTL
jgi:bacterial/archaeal transporter family protein